MAEGFDMGKPVEEWTAEEVAALRRLLVLAPEQRDAIAIVRAVESGDRMGAADAMGRMSAGELARMVFSLAGLVGFAFRTGQDEGADVLAWLDDFVQESAANEAGQ